MIKQRQVYLRRGHRALGDTKDRPCIVVSVDGRNFHSRTVIVVPCTSNLEFFLPHVRVQLEKGEGGLQSESIALCDQLAAVPQVSLVQGPFGTISISRFAQVQQAIAAAIGLFL
ncbi:MAG: type II toxin-antitoxin system PemK/MazF family toxin [Xenococcaceae cyanobacterium MO_188.B32]|nr:type II toxin-antitoxin system PemK/MazF family toxin [Xenococcaceae cyanobacterium MO_188.B32]